MDVKINLISEGDVQIVFSNFSGLKVEEIVEQFPKMEELAINNNVRNFILDISNTFSNNVIRQESKASIDRIKDKLGNILVVLIGVKGIQKIIANAISSDMYFAKDYDDAVNWLKKKLK